MSRYHHSYRMRRLLRALAPVVCPPGVETTPGTEVLLEHVERQMRSLPGTMRGALVMGAAAFELGAATRPGSLGRPASRLSPEELGAYFRSWWKSPFDLFREFAHGISRLLVLSYYEQPAIRETLDYHPDRWIDDVTQQRHRDFADAIEAQATAILRPDPLPGAAGEVQRSVQGERNGRPRDGHRSGSSRLPEGVFGRDDLDGTARLDCDVVIVGSGAGGAATAAELAEAGLDVVVLEEGGYHGTEDFNTDVGEMTRKLYRDAGATIAIGAPPVMYQEGMTVGGSTVINGGMAWRTPEKILERWDRDDKIQHILPASMEPFYERVERRIHVAYQDERTIGRDNEILKRGADRQGWKVIPNLRNQLHCTGSNNCAFGCPTGGKQSSLVTYVPRALRFGARIYSDVKVDKIRFEGTRAVGVEGRVKRTDGGRGSKVRVDAKLVVSSCGAIHTPALLHRSGFRSASGQLGRELSLHPNSKVLAVFDEDVRGWEGVHQAFQVREFQDDGFLMAAVNIPPSVMAMTIPRYGAALTEVLDDYNKIVTAGILVEDTNVGRVRVLPNGQPLAFYQLSDRDAESIRRGTSLLCELLFAAGARTVHLPFSGMGELRSADDIKTIFERPLRKSGIEVVTVHLMGTTRMGPDPGRAVTDEWGAVHGADRLFVADAGLFPSPIGVNPAETIQALATRNASHIIENLSRYVR